MQWCYPPWISQTFNKKDNAITLRFQFRGCERKTFFFPFHANFGTFEWVTEWVRAVSYFPLFYTHFLSKIFRIAANLLLEHYFEIMAFQSCGRGVGGGDNKCHNVKHVYIGDEAFLSDAWLVQQQRSSQVIVSSMILNVFQWPLMQWDFFF